MSQETINVRIDDADKKLFSKFCNEAGLSMSAAIALYIRRVNTDWAIPFEIRGRDPFWSEENQARLKKSIAQLKAHKGTVHDIAEFEKDIAND